MTPEIRTARSASRALLLPALALLLPAASLAKEAEKPAAAAAAEAETPAKEIPFDPVLFAKHLGHARGAQLGANFGPAAIEEGRRLPLEAMQEGFRAGLEGAPAPLDEDGARKMAAAFESHLVALRREQAAAAERKAAAFFDANAKKPGIHTLPGGIQYEVLAEGGGPLPDPQGGLQIRYRTSLLDGTEVESNRQAARPSFVTFGQFVPGMQTIALAMPAGARWRVWVPARLAYGENGNPPKIGPGEALCIEQETVAVFSPGEIPPEPPAEESASSTAK